MLCKDSQGGTGDANPPRMTAISSPERRAPGRNDLNEVAPVTSGCPASRVRAFPAEAFEVARAISTGRHVVAGL
jgi:hypothetical protein